jgi:putative oxidoreductase
MKIKNEHLLFVARLVLGGIFIYASLDKIVQPETFAIDIDNYRILPFSLVNFIALLLPWFELFCAVALISGVYWRTGALLVGMLLMIFIAGMISALIRGLDINCGCFGTGTAVSPWRIIEDLVLLALAIYIYRSKNTYAALENFWRTE